MTTKKTEIHGIVKVKEGVLINEDIEGLKKYKSSKMRNKKLQNLQDEFDSIKGEIGEIKNMLTALVSKL